MVTIAIRFLESPAMLLARNGERLHRFHCRRIVAKRSRAARRIDAGSSPIARPDELLKIDRLARYKDGGRDGARIRTTAAHLAVTPTVSSTSLVFIPDGPPSTGQPAWKP